MARRPHELEGTTPELDHSETETVAASTRPRRRAAAEPAPARTTDRGASRSSLAARGSRRPAFVSVGIIVATLAMLLGGGAMLSAASGAPGATSDPLANTVRAIGGAPAMAQTGALHVNENLVGIASTTSGRGYWVGATDGGVFAFGDAPFVGSLAGKRLAAPISGIVGTPSGRGYWLAGSDGGVFAFGDAPFAGSIGIPSPNFSPIVGIAATPTGRGYWLAGSDGGVFAFGDARFLGAATSMPHAPIAAIAATASGRGYYLLAADGGVFAFGDARFAGSAVDGHHLATAIAVPRDGRGYEVTRTDGSVVGQGGAPSYAATPDLLADRHPVVGIAPRAGGGAWIVTSYVPPAPVVSKSPSQDAFLRCTRAHESDSAGGYRAVSPDGLYHGAYQFLQSTWNNVARAAGRPDLVGVDPAAASPADQDQLALFLFQHAGAAPWGGRCAGLT